jgi:hypothetical protein
LLLLWTMRTRFHEYEQGCMAIPSYLVVCLIICGALGWGYHQLMQPTQYRNPGVAAYKAPPGIGLTSLPASSFGQARALRSAANESDLEHTADETTGRATESAYPEPAVAPVPPPPPKQDNIRRAARERRELRHVTHSAPSQSRPLGSVSAAYPGYAALH